MLLPLLSKHITLSPLSLSLVLKMAQLKSKLVFIFVVVFASFLVIHAQPKSTPQPPSIACKSSLYPRLCRSVLSAFRFSPTNPSSYGKFSVKQSLKQARRLTKTINRYLKKSKTTISQEERNALQDCEQLFDLTEGYLEMITLELKNAPAMTDGLIGKIETLLSGVVTNQDTCYDGLVESGSSLATLLKEPLSNATVLYSVSLGLVTHAIARDRKRGPRKGKVFGERSFPAIFSSSKLKKVLKLFAFNLYLLNLDVHK